MSFHRSLAALIGTLAACGAGPASPAHPVPVVVVVDGAAAATRRTLARFDDRVELRFAALPQRPAGAAVDRREAELENRLAAARRRWIDGDVDRCLAELGGEEEVERELGAGRRATAARLLLWRVACRIGGEAAGDALRLARRFATYDLEAPIDIERVNAEVAAALARAAGEVAAAPRAVLRVAADRARAAVSVDGRPAVCAAPCPLELPPGRHVLRVDADGRVPEVRTVELPPAGAAVSLATREAPPALAAEQWTARYAGSPAIDSLESLRLLQGALRARRLVVLSGAALGGGRTALRGAFLEPGKSPVRAERPFAAGEAKAASYRLMRDLLERGGVLPRPPPVWRRPAFWIGVTAAAALGAAVTGYLLYQPERETALVLGGEGR